MGDYITTNPLMVMLLGAYFVPFAIVAFLTIVYRAVRLKFSLAEHCLWFVFYLLVILEYLQLSSVGRSFADNAEHFGLPRYFGVFAPFLWIFAAKAAASIWGHANAKVRYVGRVAIVLALGWVLVKMNFGDIVKYRTKIQAYDTEVAVARLAPKIREDYAGPRKQRKFVRSLGEYFTGLRPVVSCPFGAAGWSVRGDHCRATGVASPYPEDYLCLPLGSGYAGIKEVDPKVYKFITIVPGGLGTQWGLFRRLSTPGRQP